MGFRKPIFDAVKAARGKPFTPAEVWQLDRALDALDVPKGPKPGAEAPTPPKGGRGALAALVGGLAASLLYTFVPEHEGKVLRGYRDPIGIPTKCYGDTNNVVVGKRYSEAECMASLDEQLLKHAKPVLACSPKLRGHPYATAAAVSLAYNIGVGAYCRSSADRHFDAGRFRAGCKALGLYTKAGGRTLPGLVRRRKAEVELCLRGVK